jgi:ATP-binding cassette, subfamily C (CFTR/MRP), member 1
MPVLVSMSKCLGRIQDLLNDERHLGAPSMSEESSAFHSLATHKVPESVRGHGELTPARVRALVDITNASFCWKEGNTPAVTVMELCIQPASFTAVIGP